MPKSLLVLALLTCISPSSFSQVKKIVASTTADLQQQMLKQYIDHMNIKDDTIAKKIIKAGADTFRYTPDYLYIQQAEIFPALNDDSAGFCLQPKSGIAIPITFEKGTTAFFNNYLHTAIGKTDSLYPVVLKIKKLSITETRSNVLYDDCKLAFAYVFECRYKNKIIPITTYDGEATMHVPLGMKKSYDSLVRESLHEAIPRIDELMGEAMDKLPDLCKAVNHTIDFRTSSETGDTIFYNGQSPLLSWSDYTGMTSNEDQFASYGGIFFQPDIDYKKGFLSISTHLGACFIKNLSQAGDNVRKEEVLRHENYRLKLIYCYTLKLKKELSELQLTIDNYKDELFKTYTAVSNEMKIAQDNYNTETRYGLKKKDQQKWEETIHDRLAAFNQ